MPTYEYRCDDCGYEFEQFQSITARPLRKCPKCGKKALDRLIGTGAAVIFKGSGFYETDYRSDSYKKAEKKETGGKEKRDDKNGEVKKVGQKEKGGDGVKAESNKNTPKQKANKNPQSQ